MSRVGRPKRLITKPCVVCGDVAISFNFGVESCESCKAFFRRNAFRRFKLRCLFTRNCVINKDTRKFCSFCRLEKCLNNGMNVSLIQVDSKRTSRQLNIRDKLASKFDFKHKDSNESNNPNSKELKRGKTKNSTSFLNEENSSESSHNSNKSLTLFKNSGSPSSGSNDAHYPNSNNYTSIIDKQNSLNTYVLNTEPLSSFPIQFSKNKLSDPCICEANLYLRPISVEESKSVKSLQEAYDFSFGTVGANEKLPSSLNPTLSSLVNSSGFMVKKLVFFAKRLADFTVLDKDSQISLLKGVFLATIFLISAAHYDPEKDAWVTPNGEVHTKILKIATGEDSNLYNEHAKFCRDFRTLMNSDRNLVSLMQVLCLFSADRPGLRNREAVWTIHDRFVLLLKHYLEAKFGFEKSREIFAAVLSTLAELQRIVHVHGHMLGHVDPTKVDPLILEVFDLGFICQYNSKKKFF